MKELPKVYLTRAGRDGEDEEYALENGLAIIGFTEFGSLEKLPDYNSVVSFVKQTKPELKPRQIGNAAGQLWAFAISMKVGDTVVLPRKLTSQVALGAVTGPYKYAKVAGAYRHTRTVKWVRPDVPRIAFGQDLLSSFGAFMTVCRISRNDAERRITDVLAGKADPGSSGTDDQSSKKTEVLEEVAEEKRDLAQEAHDQIVAHIQSRYTRHGLTKLVDAVLRADGWVTRVSPPGPDGGVDILAGRGTFGLDQPRLCVQVKSQITATDVTVYRGLQGSMQTFKAEQGLLVCWGGFNKAVQQESKQGHFSIRLWESKDLVEEIYRNYERLPAEIKAELPLKRVWTLVAEDVAE
jgi:restriction system protein